ncbi:hypothetical protein [Halalkalicoccus tibetensis]|uniref:CheR-type methyltransferase domain-containing protein n=1 Tax=Halalkalicoccus tibetensis TaxID=175632 RepID=A0ABD5V2K0_9EURY
MSETTAFDRLLVLLEEDLEFTSSYYNDAYLGRRIDARMRRVGIDEYDGYGELLRSDDDERAALLDSLSINVTGFFRNPTVWNGIRDVLRTISDGSGPTRVSAPVISERDAAACSAPSWASRRTKSRESISTRIYAGTTSSMASRTLGFWKGLVM